MSHVDEVLAIKPQLTIGNLPLEDESVVVQSSSSDAPILMVLDGVHETALAAANMGKAAPAVMDNEKLTGVVALISVRGGKHAPSSATPRFGSGIT